MVDLAGLIEGMISAVGSQLTPGKIPNDEDLSGLIRLLELQKPAEVEERVQALEMLVGSLGQDVKRLQGLLAGYQAPTPELARAGRRLG